MQIFVRRTRRRSSAEGFVISIPVIHCNSSALVLRYNHGYRPLWRYVPMTPVSSSRALEFREQLSRRILVADGAMGTMLYAHGVFINRCFDELSLSAPDLVSRIHRGYAEAGAQILEANTFGANRARLAAFGMADKLRAINEAGVRLAREA